MRTKIDILELFNDGGLDKVLDDLEDNCENGAEDVEDPYLRSCLGKILHLKDQMVHYLDSVDPFESMFEEGESEDDDEGLLDNNGLMILDPDLESDDY